MKNLFYIWIVFQLIIVGIGCTWMSRGGCEGKTEIVVGEYTIGILLPIVYFLPTEYHTCVKYNEYYNK